MCAVLFWVDPDAMAVSMSYMARQELPRDSKMRDQDWCVISDASPWKICAAVYAKNGNQVVAWTTLVLPFASDTLGMYQNNREYLGLLLTLILVHRVQQGDQSVSICVPSIRWTSDNVAALTCLEKDKARSQAAQFANIAIIWAQIYGKVQVNEGVHLAGANMGDIDGASRDKSHPSLVAATFIPTESIPGVMELFAACDPAATDTTINHIAFQRFHMNLRLVFG